MKTYLSLLLCVLLLLPIPLAEAQSFDPLRVSSVALWYKESETLDVIDTVNYLNVSLYHYPRDYSLDDFMITPAPTLRDGYLSFYEKDVSVGEWKMSLEGPIDSDTRFPKVHNKIGFPFQVGSEFEPYLEKGDKVDINLEIVREANRIVAGEDDAYVVAFKLADWVNNNIQYDESYLGKMNKASTVFQNREGVCVEYSTLLIAMLRSVGIPARYVNGVAYSNIYDGFGAHSWVEVYFPRAGWVPYDPTVGEFGWIDATHIKLADSAEPDQGAITYSWAGGKVSAGEFEHDVELLNKEEIIPQYLYATVRPELEMVGDGSYNVVWMDITNAENFYVSAEAVLRVSPKVVGANTIHVLLSPKGTSKVGWLVKIEDDLETGYKYDYQVEAEVLFGETATSSIEAKQGLSDRLGKEDAEALLGGAVPEPTLDPIISGSSGPDISISTEHVDSAEQGEEYTITFKIANKGSAAVESLEICEEECREIYVGVGSAITEHFTFTADEVGTKVHDFTFDCEAASGEQTIVINIVERSFYSRLIDLLSNIFRSINPNV